MASCSEASHTDLVVEDAHLARVRNVSLALLRLEDWICYVIVKEMNKMIFWSK